MGKIKDSIIKKLGGYTRKEWDRFLGIQCPAPKQITALDLETIVGRFSFAAEEWECLGAERRRDIAENMLLRSMCEHLEPYTEFTVLTPKPPRFSVEVVAKVRVLRQEHGGEFLCEQDREEEGMTWT